MTDAALAAPPPTDDFIRRWEASGAAERANYALFLAELCDLLGVPRPEPTRADDSENAYVFERAVTFKNPDGSTSPGRIDLYKRACFVLEAKQGSEKPAGEGLLALPRRARRGTAVRGTAGWDEAMVAAHHYSDANSSGRRCGSRQTWNSHVPSWPQWLTAETQRLAAACFARS